MAAQGNVAKISLAFEIFISTLCISGSTVIVNDLSGVARFISRCPALFLNGRSVWCSNGINENRNKAVDNYDEQARVSG